LRPLLGNCSGRPRSGFNSDVEAIVWFNLEVRVKMNIKANLEWSLRTNKREVTTYKNNAIFKA